MSTDRPTEPARRLEELSVDACLRLLETRSVGRLAFVIDGRPRIQPFNYRLVDGAIVLRTGYGDTLEVLAERPPVAFEVDDHDTRDRYGWSVVVHGRCEEVWHPDELARLRAVPLEPWVPGPRAHYVRVLPALITGRRLT